MNLPEAFCKRMKEMLGEEYEGFLASYEKPRLRGLRVNTRKISPEKFLEKAPFPVSRIPWTENGFFYGNDIYPARHPYYAAGLYYLQEPSAMAPACRLPVRAGDRVLDLCAAPGGKSTELAARLEGTGILVANDASSSRAKALLRNLELFGTENLLVTNELPVQLAGRFPSWFHAVLVDAPCSGEGMFRKDPAVAETWSPERVAFFARTQRNILENAWKMLMPGGYLMYSTCTFSPEEDEQMIRWFLDSFPDAEIREMPDRYEGFSEGRPEWADGDERVRKCVRIWPHVMEGEGHFLALLQKMPSDDAGAWQEETQKEKPGKRKKEIRSNKKEKSGKQGAANPAEKRQAQQFEEFLSGIRGLEASRIRRYGDRAYLACELPDTVRGMNFLRNGCFIGEWKKERFEPSQPLAMILDGDSRSGMSYSNVFSLQPGDERIGRYLHGETIRPDPEDPAECRLSNGWALVCVEDYPLGWAKYAGGVLKNKYPASWREK